MRMSWIAQLKCKAGSGFYLIKVGVFIISIIIISSIYLFLYGLHRSLSILHSCACHRFACVFLMQRTQALHMCWSHHSWITLSTRTPILKKKIRHMRTHWCAWCALSGSVELQMGCSHQSSQQDIWLSRCFYHGQVGAAASPCYTGCETPEERSWKCVLAMHQWFFFSLLIFFVKKPKLQVLFLIQYTGQICSV